MSQSLDEITHAGRELLRALEPPASGEKGAIRETLGKPAVGEQAHERICEPTDVAGWHEQATNAVFHDVGNATGTAPYDRAAARERLHRHTRQAFRERRQHESRRT